MLTSTIILALLLTAALVDRHVTGTRHARTVTESRQFAADLATQLGREHAAHRAELQTLLQRIQAPEIAVIQHAQETTSTATVPPRDDKESAEAQDALLAVDTAIEDMVRRENEIHGLIGSVS